MDTKIYASQLYKPRVGVPETGRGDKKALERTESSLREQVAALQARNRELAAYAHTVSHDLKDPLSVIVATADAIFHITDLTPEELRAYLQQIQSTAHTMNSTIDNLLLFSELADSIPEFSPVDMEEIVERIRLRLAFMIRQHHARLELPEHWPSALGYGPWIEEVWANLISNAIKYGGRPPRVQLGSTVHRDGTVEFWARDNGAGISQDIGARLFQRHGSLGPPRAGSHGLGLSIVKRIVEKLGGEVGFDTQIGRGSRFFFTLPPAK